MTLVTDRITRPRDDYQLSSRVETYQRAIDDLENYALNLTDNHAEAGLLV